MPMIMFTQRFIESFKVRDRKAKIGGIKYVIAITIIISGVSSAIPPGIELNTIDNVIIQNSRRDHNTAIFIFQSSRVSPPHNNVSNICDSRTYKTSLFV